MCRNGTATNSNDSLGEIIYVFMQDNPYIVFAYSGLFLQTILLTLTTTFVFCLLVQRQIQSAHQSKIRAPPTSSSVVLRTCTAVWLGKVSVEILQAAKL